MKTPDLAPFREELKELAGEAKVTLRVDTHLKTACSVGEYDRNGVYGFDCRINPQRIRSEQSFLNHLEFIRKSVAGGMS